MEFEPRLNAWRIWGGLGGGIYSRIKELNFVSGCPPLPHFKSGHLLLLSNCLPFRPPKTNAILTEDFFFPHFVSTQKCLDFSWQEAVPLWLKCHPRHVFRTSRLNLGNPCPKPPSPSPLYLPIDVYLRYFFIYFYLFFIKLSFKFDYRKS